MVGGVLGPLATFREAAFAVFFLKVYTVLAQMGSSRNSDPAKLVTMGQIQGVGGPGGREGRSDQTLCRLSDVQTPLPFRPPCQA